MEEENSTLDAIGVTLEVVVGITIGSSFLLNLLTGASLNKLVSTIKNL